MVFDEIMPHALSLMTDVFGNYVIQKVIFLKSSCLLFSSSLYYCFLFCRNTWELLVMKLRVTNLFMANSFSCVFSFLSMELPPK